MAGKFQERIEGLMSEAVKVAEEWAVADPTIEESDVCHKALDEALHDAGLDEPEEEDEEDEDEDEE